MTALQLLGDAMIALPVVALFVILWWKESFWFAASLHVATAALTALIVSGVMLSVGVWP